MKTLALFDFDGTLYKKDSLIEFTKFSKGNVAFILGMLLLFPFLVAYKIGLITNQKAKQYYISHFFKGIPISEFSYIASEFAKNKIAPDLDEKNFSAFKSHIEAKDTVCIVTASSPLWVKSWSDPFGVSILGTELQIADSKITGLFETKNCFGIEKVNRIKSSFSLDEFDKIYVYGGGKGDREMLKLSK